MDSKSSLHDVVKWLVGGADRQSFRLSRGLALAYTPAGLNDGRFRLVLSRVGELGPAVGELAIVRMTLCVVLNDQERPFDGMDVGDELIYEKGRYRVIEWGEYVQERLV